MSNKVKSANKNENASLSSININNINDILEGSMPIEKTKNVSA